MTELDLVPDKSRIVIRTFAEGLFARLAHDLELVCKTVDGTAERVGEATATARIEVPVRGIDVVGIVGKDGRVDERGLSTGDRRDLLDKMQRDVFQAKDGAAVRIAATLDGRSARVRIVPPNGRAIERTVSVAVSDEGSGARVKGKIDVSLAAIGSAPVKGPMNAFRVKDLVEIHFDVVFAPR